MEEMNLDYDSAKQHVRTGRCKARPNSGFAKQLKLWRTLNFSIYDDAGKETPEYTFWEIENERDCRKPKLVEETKNAHGLFW